MRTGDNTISGILSLNGDIVKHMEGIRAFLGIEAAAFALAALVHAGILLGGYQHRQAAIAETVIAVVLTLGLILSLLRPYLSRWLVLGVQGFALLGTLVGIFAIAIGVGPQSRFDVALHLGFVTLLSAGLVVGARRTSADPRFEGEARTR